MDSNQANSSFFSQLQRELSQVWSAVAFSLDGGGVWFRNQLRRLRDLETDYVVIPLSGTLPERSGPPRGFLQRRLPLPDPPYSMQRLNHQLRLISDAGNVKGVLFIFQGLTVGLATLQSLRMSIQRLREAGKEVIVFTPYLDLAHYFAAAAADRIVVPPTSRFEVLGMRVETAFLKDALARIGVQADVVQISPFKTAYNELGESVMTAEHEQQLNWILDDAFDHIVAAIAQDRGLDPAEVKALIDRAPLSAQAAVSAGLIDDIAYEDALPGLLAAPRRAASDDHQESNPVQDSAQKTSVNSGPKASFSTWSEARAIMLEKRRRPSRKYIGVVSLEGAITMGSSRSSPLPIPFFSANRSGERTLVNLLRRAEKDRRLAALIIQIDSGGGSALASDLIWRQVQRIAEHLPVVTYMGNTAASGGYYIAAPSSKIVCQPLTVTGSIGVVTFHLSTKGLFEKLDINRVSLQRGARANLTSDMAPLSDEERQVFWVEITDAYQRFLEIVSAGRELEPDSLDAICNGRVWTGNQARDRGLVDEHGDFEDAVAAAASLAGLVQDDKNEVVVANLYPDGATHVLPKPIEDPAELLKFFSQDWLANLAGKPLFLMPAEIKFR